MPNFDFTLHLPDVTEPTDSVADALVESGCDDATLSVRCGRAYLVFSRAAPTLDEAVRSAIHDAGRAGYRAALYSGSR
jgi:hypothetical protein